MAEVLLAAADSDAEAEAGAVADDDGETAPHYGECGRDRLLTLTERDPPPYDLAYESTRNSVLASRAGSSSSGGLQGLVSKVKKQMKK